MLYKHCPFSGKIKGCRFRPLSDQGSQVTSVRESIPDNCDVTDRLFAKSEPLADTASSSLGPFELCQVCRPGQLIHLYQPYNGWPYTGS